MLVVTKSATIMVTTTLEAKMETKMEDITMTPQGGQDTEMKMGGSTKDNLDWMEMGMEMITVDQAQLEI